MKKTIEKPLHLYNECCIDVMKMMYEKCVEVDLTVTSPPYDNLRNYENEIEWNFDIFKRIADRIYSITKPGGILVWIVGDACIKGSETGTSFEQVLYFKKLGFLLHDTMIYEKNSSTFPARRNGNRYTQIFEYMFILSRDKKPKTSNLICDKKNKWAGHSSFDGKIPPVPDYSPRTNIWKYTTSFNDKTGHPAVAPENMIEDHILSWSIEGDLIFDPFMGSGTTGKMALINKRKFIGVERVKKYYEISEKRLETLV